MGSFPPSTLSTRRPELLSVHCDTSEEITRAKDILKRTGATDIASAGEEAVGAASKPLDTRTP